MIGDSLGPYRILEKLGEGGMGQVYRATDTTLKRSVAIKVLPPTVSSNIERLARFQREAEVLASLNHPNIAQIYGLHQADGAKALVMELVEGPTLADRIARGPIPLAETLGIAKQIADALESAHEHGIVHRDLKPANIKVRDDGTVKVLDFGLARGFSDSTTTSPDSLAMSPTLTSPAMTQVGMILGTAAYMSPEQARGKAVDARADVWAFGCVLYEMLTGKRAFTGEEVSDALASVLARDPNWDAAPASVVALLKKCLEKDPKKRLRHIGDWELLLVQPTERTIAPERRSAGAWGWPIATALVTATAIAVAVVAWTARSTPSEGLRLRINPQLPSTIVLPTTPNIEVSPDGRRAAIVTRGTTDGPAIADQIWLWSLDTGTATPLAGTEGAHRFFWSPDGRFLAAVIGGVLKKFDTSGGPSQTVVTGLQPEEAGVTGFGGAWNKDNVILLESARGGLTRLSADGGSPTEVTRIGAADLHDELPTFLPDDRHFLYFRHARDPEQMGIYVGDLEAPPADQRQTRVLAADDGLLYLEDREGGDGIVLFTRRGTLLAQRFDAAALEFRGSPIAIAADLSSGSGNGWLSASRSGSVLVYATGFTVPGPGAANLTWVDRSGRDTPLPLPRHNYQYPRLSPDGKRLAVAQETERPGESDLWVYNVESGAALRLTHAGKNTLPVWSSDGERIVFSSTQHRPPNTSPPGQWGNLYSIRSDGSGNVERLTTDADISQALSGLSPDGRHLFYTKVISVPDHWEITRVGLDKGGVQTTLLPGRFRRSSAEVSPDGGLIAYRSDDTGAFEIYVQTYPEMDAKIPVSVGGGDSPVWSVDGKELFYRAGERVMAVEVTRRPTLRATPPRELFRGTYVNPAAAGRQYHVGPDGRFVMLKRSINETAPAPPKIVLDVNWLEALQQR